MPYRERPSDVESGTVWTIAPGATVSGRVLPDGCVDLLWLDDDLVVAGPDTRAYVAASGGDQPVVGLRVGGGVGPAAFGIPAYAVRDLRVPVADVWGVRTAGSLRRRVASAPDIGAELERIIGSRLESSPADAAMSVVDALARRGCPVPSIAAAVGLSERQLHRRTREAFGYGAKTLSRIHRFQAALAFARAGLPPADAAVRAGYADQPHLAREVRTLAGEPMSALLG